jgi:ribosome maturation factor RimP
LVREALIKELDVFISACLKSRGLELIDFIYRFDGQRLILTVLADKPQGNGLVSTSQSHKPQSDGLASSSQSHKPQSGITLQECAWLCRQLKNLLEEKNIIDGDYVLEVSSPGLDRPLKRQRDFLYSLNKEAVFFLNDLVNGKCQWQGIISKVDEAAVFIQVPGEILEVPLIKINKAQLVI